MEKQIYVFVDDVEMPRHMKPGITLEGLKEKYPEKKFAPAKVPSIKTMEKWMMDGVAKTPCGCRVEPDGSCSHGKKSWLLLMGVV